VGVNKKAASGEQVVGVSARSKMRYACAFLCGYNDFDSSRMDDASYLAYLEGCVYMNIRVALAVGFSHVIFFLLDMTQTLDYGKKYTKIRDERGNKIQMIPPERRGELSSMLRRGADTGDDELDKEHAFRVIMNRIFRKMCDIPELRDEGRVLCKDFPEALASLEKESDYDSYHFTHQSMLEISAKVCEMLHPALHLDPDLRIVVFTDSTLDREHRGKESVADIANRQCDRIRFLTVGGSTLCVKDKRFLEFLWDLFVPPKTGLRPTAGMDKLWHAMSSGDMRHYLELIYPSENRILANRRQIRRQYSVEPSHPQAGPFVSALQTAQNVFLNTGT